MEWSLEADKSDSEEEVTWLDRYGIEYRFGIEYYTRGQNNGVSKQNISVT